jgi:hypothetical protein
MWKTLASRLAVALSLYSMSVAAGAATLFTEDFESGLAAWSGKSSNITSGLIAIDPLDPTNSVLTFSRRAAGGDIFSRTIFPAITAPGAVTLEFDYLGACGQADCGGFLGLYSQNATPTDRWLAATKPGYPGSIFTLQDTGQWTHATATFSSATSYRLMLEQFNGSPGGLSGPIFFDNIQLSTIPAVPEPPMLPLLLCGGAMLAFTMRRRKN